MKHTGTNRIKDVSKLYTEQYKTLLRKVKDELN